MHSAIARSDAAGTAAVAPPPTADTYTLQLLKDNFGTDFTIDPRLRRSIMSGQCVAFIGAGFSKGVTNMDWSILIQKLVEHVGEAAKLLPSEADCSAAAADDIREKKEKAKYIMHEFQKQQKGYSPQNSDAILPAPHTSHLTTDFLYNFPTSCDAALQAKARLSHNYKSPKKLKIGACVRALTSSFSHTNNNCKHFVQVRLCAIRSKSRRFD